MEWAAQRLRAYPVVAIVALIMWSALRQRVKFLASLAICILTVLCVTERYSRMLEHTERFLGGTEKGKCSE